jgi:hypothetical protein
MRSHCCLGVCESVCLCVDKNYILETQNFKMGDDLN